MDDTAAPALHDRFAADLRGFGPVGILTILAIIAAQALAPLGAVLVLVWRNRTRTPWPAIGYVRPRSWIAGLLIGIVFGVALKLFMKAIVMPLLGADPINPAYQHLVGNTVVALFFIPELIIKSGWGEETVFRGFLFERLGTLLGRGVGAKIATVLLTSVLFGSLHYFDQGLAGVQQAVGTGLVFGTIFAITGRIWMLMCAHAAFNLTAVAIIYWNLEAAVAHAVFR